MDAWVIWLVAAVVLAIGEISSPSFFLGPFAIGAALAAIASLAGGGDVLPWIVFTVATVASFAFIRPVARRHLRQPPQVRTGTAALIGRRATVTQRISNREDSGMVRLDGEAWTARAFDDDQVFEAGQQVDVVEIRGATALVTE
jgi:membrane protein implicated in regulation of membrane protease activity